MNPKKRKRYGRIKYRATETTSQTMIRKYTIETLFQTAALLSVR
jgi:hypothetical protein